MFSLADVTIGHFIMGFLALFGIYCGLAAVLRRQAAPETLKEPRAAQKT